MLVLVAVLGLLGTVVASNTLSDWLRRRDLREAIKADLEIWEKLPNGVAKQALMSRIEGRLDGPSYAPGRRNRNAIASLIGAIFAVTVVYLMNWIGGTIQWERGTDGMLRAHRADGSWTTFKTFVLQQLIIFYVLLFAGIGFIALTKKVVGMSEDKILARRSQKQKRIIRRPKG